ncbi:MAG: hypothetical protein KatS3mg015_3117 [Fimbriimonadales bacterium]|nr:MAG: hypothetical protein KatS3mg015_3117 [Fimbriimonadales bacterium]
MAYVEKELIAVNQTICAAIGSRRVLRFYYGGGPRTVEPHCYGRSRKGDELLRGYQTGGYSESRESVGWKLFHVSDISGLQLTGDSFVGPRAGYNPQDSAMEIVFCRL